MAGEPARLKGALGPLVAEFEQLAQTCRDLRQQVEREATERRAAVRARDELLAEVARLRSRGPGVDPQASSDVAALRTERRALEDTVREQAATVTGLTQRGAALEAELDAARAELAIAEEERTCLEEQIRHLARTVALLKTENRLLRREARPAGADPY